MFCPTHPEEWIKKPRYLLFCCNRLEIGNVYRKCPHDHQAIWSIQRSTPYSNSATNWTDNKGNILFHFNPRPEENQIIMNSKRFMADDWGGEERITLPEGNLDVTITLDKNGFEVKSKQDSLFLFKHRFTWDINQLSTYSPSLWIVTKIK
eukprot:gene7946-10782_t